jgi:NADPH-dependent 2,4-dienoyl-CoA reductase/sulfur reductase-like enzyme
MKKEFIDIAIIGGGCAGLSAALAARESGAASIVVFERSPYLGGVLRQCIHNGFGIHRFGEDLTGTQYARRLVDSIAATDIVCLTDTIVLDMTPKRTVTVMNSGGMTEYRAKAVIIATGCRERSRGALAIPGTRPAGVMCAGTAQRYLNIEGCLAGKRIVILGSGDIGLIMARQFMLEGAAVIAVAEVMSYSAGLMRNIVQCLEDFDIPLYYRTTVTHITGDKRVEGVYLAEVDECRMPIAATERFVACDTLILSVGLIPENELASQTGIPLSDATGGPLVDDAFQTGMEGIFACGNALHVHDLVDFVSLESEAAGRSAALYAAGAAAPCFRYVNVLDGKGVRGTVPQKVCLDSGSRTVTLQFRPDKRYGECFVDVYSGSRRIARRKQRVLTPGEMAEIKIRRAEINATLTVQVRDVPAHSE